MKRTRHVAILIETSRAYGRGLLRGIARYNREFANWATYFQPQGLDEIPPPWLKTWRGDGIIARVDNRRVAEALEAAGVPVVNLRGTVSGLPFPFIGSDNDAVAQLAVDHLRDRAFRNYAFCGFPRESHPGLDRRGDRFRERVGHSAPFEHRHQQ